MKSMSFFFMPMSTIACVKKVV